MSIISSKKSMYSNGTYVNKRCYCVPLLPSGYTALDYIESTGTQWIDTGVSSSSSLTWQLDLEAMSSDMGGFGVIYAGSSNMTIFVFASLVSLVYFGASSGGKTGGSVGTTRHTIILDGPNHTFSNDGASITFPERSFSNGPSLYLFKVRNYTSARQVLCKLYASKFWDNGVLIQDLVPAKRTSDNVVGMYDTVTGTFFTSQSEDNFVAGAETTLVKIVEANTSSYYKEDNA